MRARTTPKLAGPLGTSALMHLAVVTLAVLLVRTPPPQPMPPTYRVNLVAAPAGARAIGEVRAEPARPVEKPTPPPPAKKQVTKKVPAVSKKTKVVTAPKAVTPAPKVVEASKKVEEPPPPAGGGPEGGKGSDVANVRTEGIEFPFPEYLNNITRQIALEFRPPDPNSPLKAEVFFLIYRDGTISPPRVRIRSGNRAFDLEALAAVEAASKRFGRLPDGFPDDVLPISFSFDPKFFK